MSESYAPFLTLLTSTYRRPKQLAACLASVAAQTAVADIEHVVLPDHVGLGIGAGLYGRVPHYAQAVHGQYVNLLCDDDVLAAPDVVERVRAFVQSHHQPPAVIVVEVAKGIYRLPSCMPEGRPICGNVDLTSFIVRADIWQAHVHDYGLRYEGDYDHALALYNAGHPFTFFPLVWAIGAVSRGQAEEAVA